MGPLSTQSVAWILGGTGNLPEPPGEGEDRNTSRLGNKQYFPSSCLWGT